MNGKKITYTVTLPAAAAMSIADRPLVWNVTGTNPDGTAESPQTAIQIVKSAYAPDTPLTFS